MSRAARGAMVRRPDPELSLSRQCRLLSIGRSWLYYTPQGESAEALARMRRIGELFLKHPFFGARQIVRHLRREGVRIGRRRAGRLMRLMGLQAIYRAPRTGEPHPEHRVHPYLLKGLAIERANHVGCADITYIPVLHGFLYLVAILDWASRYVLAWRLSNTLDAGFCVEALEEARTRHGQPEIFNTDQGSQVTGFAFTGRLRAAGAWTTSSSSGCGAPSNTRLSICTTLPTASRPGASSASESTSTTPNRHTRPSAEKTPAEAYRGGPPADMMDKPLRALPTYPQAQQRRQEDRSKEILAR